MKKFVLLAAAAAMGTMAVNATTVLAAQTNGGVYSTNGSIEFKPTEKVTKPVDPLDPTKTATPIDAEDPKKVVQPGTQGPLSIDFASSFNFGKQEITSETKTYFAAAQKYQDAAGTEKVGPNFVQVTDNRGTEAGWKLVVKQNDQLMSVSGKELTGAQIRLKNGHVVTASTAAHPDGTAEMTLVPGAEQTVMNAKTGSGTGTHLLNWGKDADDAARSVELTVPGATTKYAEKYATTFTWTLTDTPDNK
ncbi:WxL domain-containing protein [Lacticaseibacillus paracasei]|uniref:WxL domain-containing protein n=1 Tax=Lacticaseibacillus paracasei TaxID=1597 RepID=UPI0021A36324|nr:WxL domain-containing protein [Lacticaseibacillus paracasei]MCT2892429.1 WxL domain-containing protein [Lacticaseibacillus paracasei]